MLLDNQYLGRRGFLIGGGPSINTVTQEGFDFKSLENEITVGVNKAYKLLNPTILFYQDDYIWEKFQGEMLQLPESTEIVCPYFTTGAGNVRNSSIHAVLGKANLPESFSTPIGTKNNVGVTALRIMYILGLNPIYLVGIDLRKEDASPEKFNFHTDYDYKRQKVISPEKIAKFRKYFIETIDEMMRKGREIFSCSKVSTLNAHIPYVDLKNII